MSFQDFGGGGRSSTRLSSSTNSRPASASLGSQTMGQSTLNQISESLLQYQRNVGILEKIVQSLTQTNHRGASFQNRQELETQYQAQADVIEQLGNKVHNLISDQKKTERNPTIKTTLIKLERDFDRVQKQANLLQATVQKIKEQRAATNQEVSENTALEEYQRQMQVQMQEDRLAEQIMREREDEIRNINRGMHQVNEIYKDLAHIVESQQEQVDAIETQMEDSRANAEAGLTQIEKANDNFGSSNCVIS